MAKEKTHMHGHPGETLKMKSEGATVGHSHKQSDMEPAVLKAGNGMHGGSGTTAGMGSGNHGFGHSAIQRQGSMRMSGTPGAHRIGCKK